MISKPSNPGVEFGGEDRNQTKIAAFSKLTNRPLSLHSTLRVQYQSSIDQLPIYYRFTGTFTGCRFDCEARVDSQHSSFVRSSPALPERRRREQSRSFKTKRKTWTQRKTSSPRMPRNRCAAHNRRQKGIKIASLWGGWIQLKKKKRKQWRDCRLEDARCRTVPKMGTAILRR
jgi:hypothetical protein